MGQQCCAILTVSTTKMEKTQTIIKNIKYTFNIKNGLNITGQLHIYLYTFNTGGQLALS